jgi:adenine/guanine phosphoribosyltransferase-like PRPP-binding protein
MHIPQYYHCGYLHNVLERDSLKECITLIIRHIEQTGVEFDSFAFTGMSGTIPGSILAYSLNKTMIMVRKEGDNSHSFEKVEGDIAAKKYIIIDDFICDGNTVRNIFLQIRHFAPEAVCIGGIFLNSLRSGLQIIQTSFIKQYCLRQ